MSKQAISDKIPPGPKGHFLLGNGLLLSNGKFHHRQRALIQPAFHARRIKAYGRTMVGYTQHILDRWQSDRVLDIDHEIMRLTVFIVAKTLFDVDVLSRTYGVRGIVRKERWLYWIGNTRIQSMTIFGLSEADLERLRELLDEEIERNGAVEITKESGMFIASLAGRV